MGNRGSGDTRRGFKKWFRDQREKIRRGPVGRGIRVILRTIRQIGETSWSLLIPGVAGLLILLLGVALVEELRAAGKPDPKLVATLAGFILLAAVAARLGETLKDRLKKIGPLELFATEVHDLLAVLRDLDLRPAQEGHGKGGLSLEEQWKYKQADRLVTQIEHSSLKMEGTFKRRFRELLLFVASTALYQKEWWQARARFELLLELSDDKDDLAQAHHNLGLAYLECAETQPHDKRVLDLERALHQFRIAAQKRPERYESLFFEAYVLDALSNHSGAVEKLDQVLVLRSQYAPAKYNAASALTKQKKLKEAKDRLEGIEITDEKAREMLESAKEDPDLQLLRDDPQLGEEILRGIEEKLASRPDPDRGA